MLLVAKQSGSHAHIIKNDSLLVWPEKHGGGDRKLEMEFAWTSVVATLQQSLKE